MDNAHVSKETLVIAIRGAISHVNRNLYEWTIGSKKGRIQATLSFTEVKGVVRNWLVPSLREKIGYNDADRLFRNMYITIDTNKAIINSISLSSEGSWSKYFSTVREILSELNYCHLAYDPNDYVMDGMSERKPGFDPFFYISLESIKSIKF